MMKSNEHPYDLLAFCAEVLVFIRCGLNDAWWRHVMETNCVLLATCAGNSLVSGEFPRPQLVLFTTRSAAVDVGNLM